MIYNFRYKNYQLIGNTLDKNNNQAYFNFKKDVTSQIYFNMVVCDLYLNYMFHFNFIYRGTIRNPEES